MERNLKIIRAEGSHYDLGYEHGRQCRDLICELARKVLPELISGSDKKIDAEIVISKASDYKSYIADSAPHLLDEIRGIADGAGIKFAEALALQCRSELVYRGEQWGECTSFAVSKERSTTGEVIVGQNVDLSSQFEPFGVILLLYPTSGPAILTWTLAGTLGQVGLNSACLARCGNVLFSPGWRIGLPTTVLWRLILEQPTVHQVAELIQRVHRAKSNNFMVGDGAGTIADIETTVTLQRLIEPVNGVIMHTNHYLHKDLISYECSKTLKDSQLRFSRLKKLFDKHPGTINTTDLQAIMRDHFGRPHSICKHEGHSKTVFSLIIHSHDGYMEFCPGNPCSGVYRRIEL